MNTFITIYIFLVLLLHIPLSSLKASSQQAYQDYQYQFDLYRSRLSDYQVAIHQYNQFQSLSAQQDALEKGKLILAQRAMVGRTYFLFLNEKLTENPGLTSADIASYRTLLTNQISTLDQQTALAAAVTSFTDADRTSDKFAANYNAMQSLYRQIICMVQLGYLNYFAERFERTAVHAQALIAASKTSIQPDKQVILDRWILALTNKRAIYQQKATAIRASIAKISGDVSQQDKQYMQIQNAILAARQDIVDAVSYIKEIEHALTYD